MLRAVPGAAGEDLRQGTARSADRAHPAADLRFCARYERWKTYSPGAGPTGR